MSLTPTQLAMRSRITGRPVDEVLKWTDTVPVRYGGGAG